MHEDFASLLEDDGTVAGLVSTRITWGLVPQAAGNPAVSMHEIDAPPTYTMQGQSDLVAVRVQVDCRGTTFASAMTVARAVRARLSGFSGLKGDTDFRGIFQTNGRSYSEKPGDKTFHVVSTDFDVWSRPLVS